jgi:hypothetical protein
MGSVKFCVELSTDIYCDNKVALCCFAGADRTICGLHFVEASCIWTLELIFVFCSEWYSLCTLRKRKGSWYVTSLKRHCATITSFMFTCKRSGHNLVQDGRSWLVCSCRLCAPYFCCGTNQDNYEILSVTTGSQSGFCMGSSESQKRRLPLYKISKRWSSLTHLHT